MFTNARFIGNPSFQLKGGYTSDKFRDEAMTLNSDFDIAFPEDVEDVKKRLGQKFNPKHISGTQQNLNRRGNLCF